MKNCSLLLCTFLSMACAAQSADSLRMPLSALLAPVKDGQPAQMQHELFTSYMISSRAMLDTASDWQLVSSEHRDWQQIVGQPRYDHMELYRSKNEAMALSAALLINAFRLNDTVNRRWHVVANADGTTGIAAYSGNPNANMTSWEDAWVYTFHAVQKYSRPFRLDSLLDETADPSPFLQLHSGSPDELHTFAVTDTSRWLLLGFDHSAWTSISGKDQHINYYKKYVGKPGVTVDGATLIKQFGTNVKYTVAEEPLRVYLSNWKAYLSAEGIMIIRMNTYQPGNMTDRESATSYYFRPAGKAK